MIDLEALVPACYEKFRPLLREGLDFFLARLSVERRDAIVKEQIALGLSVPLEQRAVAFLKHCPTLHKLGQVLARHPSLDQALRAQLQTLESLPASLSMDDLEPIIEAELGDRAAALTLGTAPLAEGSVAVVVPFTIDSPAPGEPREGILKILKPGIEALITEELQIVLDLGDYLEARSRVHDLPPLGYRETFEQVAKMLSAEIRPESEQEHLAAAASLYSRVRGVRIPRLISFHGERITAMERVNARKITEPGVLDAAASRRLVQQLVEALLARPFFSSEPTPLFHGDPHAGNLLLDDRRRIVIIDWSLAGTMNQDARHAVTAILIGALTLNRKRVLEGLRRLLEEPIDEELLEREVDAALRDVPWEGLPGFDWLLNLLDRLAFGGAKFAPEFTLFRKALFTLNGVFTDISKDFSINVPIVRIAVLQFYRELLKRLLPLPGRRGFGIALTNTELMALGMSWPLTATRYWFAALRALGRRLS